MMSFGTECTTFEQKLARVGWLIDELTKGRKRAVAAELKLSRSTLARILAHFGLKLEVVLAAAEEARTPEEMRYFASGSVQLVAPARLSGHLVRLDG